MTLQFSEKESKRFGIKVYRSKVEKVEESKLFAAMQQEKADLVILRVPTSEQPRFFKLERFGIPIWHADTLVYYTCNLLKYVIHPLQNKDLNFEQMNASHGARLDKLVRDTFVDYQNHYSANPYLPKQTLLAGYREWAQDFLASPNRTGWIVQKDGKDIGFCLTSFDGDESEGGLYGVIPEAAGGGVYADMIRFTQRFYQDQGKKVFRVSTQVGNFPVQKVWAREGHYLTDAYSTIHICSFLNHGADRSFVEDLVVTDDDLKRFGKVSGDTNKIHFDAQFAKKKGFKDRIAHGMLIGTAVSRIIGTKFPGDGAIIVSLQQLFMKPIYLNTKHILSLSIVHENTETGFRLVIIKVTTEGDGALCVLGYATIKAP